jgi:hypothetical protein
MARNRDWQERGVRIAGKVLSEEETSAMVAELRRRIRDPQVLEEAEQVIRGERDALSPRVRDVLLVILASLVMMQRK